MQKFGKEKGQVASRTVALSKNCIHLSLCLWKQMMWSALLVFDKPAAWLAWRRVKLYASVPTDSVVGSLLWSQLTFPWLDRSVSDYTITWMSHAASSPLLVVLLRPVNQAQRIWNLTLISGLMRIGNNKILLRLVEVQCYQRTHRAPWWPYGCIWEGDQSCW